MAGLKSNGPSLFKKDDVGLFRAEIHGHTNSKTILLLTAQFGAVQLEPSLREKRRKVMVGSMQTTSQLDVVPQNSERLRRDNEIQRLMALMPSMSLQLKAANGGKTSHQHLQMNLPQSVQNISGQSMRMHRVGTTAASRSQQGKLLLEASVNIIRMNLKIFGMIHEFQRLIMNLPGQANRVMPFDLEFIQSAEAFLDVVNDSVRQRGCDTAMLDQGNFFIFIEDTRTGVRTDRGLADAADETEPRICS